jgi:hypothetical protein
MNMKKIIVILGIFFALSVILSLSSLYYIRKIGREMGGGIPSGPREIRQAIPKEKELRVSDPGEYGMVVIDEHSGPQTQEDWDRIISQKVSEAKTHLSQDDLEKIANKIKEDPQKTANKIKVIDENIQKCQEILRSDTGNKEARQKLERLRMLKGISRDLP